MNRRARRVGLSVVAVTALGLAIDFVAACNRHVAEKRAARLPVPSAAQCEDWCPCKCHQSGCGCHESGKPKHG